MRIFLLITFLLCQSVSLPQEILEKKIKVNCFSVGLFFNYNIVFHNIDFTNSSEFLDCNPVKYGASLNDGFRFGVNGTIPINDLIRFCPSASYSRTFFGDNTRDAIPINLNGSFTNSTLVNEIEGNIIGFYIETLFGFNIFDRFFISAGISSEYLVDVNMCKYIYLEGASYKKLEYIYNLDKKKMLYFTPVIEICYDYFLGIKDFGIIVSPAVKYEYAIYSFLEEKDWKFNKLTFGLSVRYTDNILKFREY